MKKQITSSFNKNKYKINDAPIDSYIKEFMFNLNKSKDIMTMYSCEGHRENDDAYLYFNVSDEGWDVFWLKVMPELSYKFCRPTEEGLLSQTEWYVSTTDLMTKGISIHCSLRSNFRYDWDMKKELFWEVIEETFLKYFKEDEIQLPN